MWDEHRGKALPEGEQVEVCDVEGLDALAASLTEANGGLILGPRITGGLCAGDLLQKSQVAQYFQQRKSGCKDSLCF